ncbi:MAG: succinate dehydrogenase, hydrophobic membrane anchor protein [Chromatiales bacterium]
MSLRTNLGAVRGFGSAKEGTHHWWMQRLTAVALVPLSLWFVVAIVKLTGDDYPTAVTWMASPLNAALLLALIIAVFYHAQLGMQVIFEDYIHTEWVKVTVQMLLKFTMLLLALIATIAVLKISLGA